MVNTVSKKEVEDFKEVFCNENSIIIRLINGFSSYFQPPILDVGSGIGDIAFKAFSDKKAYLIDRNEIDENKHPLSQLHTKLTGDFFTSKYPEKINTLFICHTLQFIDDDIERLHTKIAEINPNVIILVSNINDGSMGDIINWVYKNYKDPNPEIQINGFPNGYILKESMPFTAVLKANDFDSFCRQIGYLMLIDISIKYNQLYKFITQIIQQPEIIINQKIEIFIKDGK